MIRRSASVDGFRSPLLLAFIAALAVCTYSPSREYRYRRRRREGALGNGAASCGQAAASTVQHRSALVRRKGATCAEAAILTSTRNADALLDDVQRLTSLEDLTVATVRPENSDHPQLPGQLRDIPSQGARFAVTTIGTFRGNIRFLEALTMRVSLSRVSGVKMNLLRRSPSQTRLLETIISLDMAGSQLGNP